MTHATYTTFNNKTDVFVVFSAVSHVINDKDNGCWIWFHSGKCIHVSESMSDVQDDISDYLDTRK